MVILPSDVGESRLAVAITTKIDKRSVVRNKIKRRLREIFRSIRHDFIKPIDMVVVARRGVQDCEFEQYKRELIGALRSNRYL